jgi:hypothetical protein
MTAISVKTDWTKEETSANRQEEFIAKLGREIEESWLATAGISELTKQAVEALHRLNSNPESS